MDAYQTVEGDRLLDCTPVATPDGRFTARALVTRRGVGTVDEVTPSFESFATEAEAAVAAHMAAIAWSAHQPAA